jgi:hypothetical protein
LKTVVDNVAIYAIEQNLLVGLEELFSPSEMMSMDDELIRIVSVELPENERLRPQTAQKLKILQEGLATVQTYALRKRKGQHDDILLRL